MRTTIITALAAAAVATALFLPTQRAEAITPARIAAAADAISHVEKTRAVWVCRRFWNGYRWVRRCRWVNVYYGGPYYYGPSYGPYYGYGPYYRRPWRRW